MISQQDLVVVKNKDMGYREYTETKIVIVLERTLMATSDEYLDYVLDLLSEVEGINHRKMMGEYMLYCDGKVFGGIYDENFLVKDIESTRRLIPNAERRVPYVGAHEMLLVDFEDKHRIAELVETMAAELPTPKPKKRKGDKYTAVFLEEKTSAQDDLKAWSEDINSDMTFAILASNSRSLKAASDDVVVAGSFESADNLIGLGGVEASFDESVSEMDKWDYLVAAASGMLTAALDILWVGKISLKDANDWGGEKSDDIVKKCARVFCGYDGDDLAEAIKILENSFPIPSDKLKDEFGGGRQHHNRDFIHHPSPVGLVFSILSQFTGKGYGTDTVGNFIRPDLLGTEHIGKNFAEKIYNAIVVWLLHLVSDMAGSNQYAGAGTGIPGPLLSLLKEFSVLPFAKNLKVKYKDDEIGLSVFAAKLFNGTFFRSEENPEGIKFNLRTELGLVRQITKQFVPVVLNECIVRVSYALRRLYLEIRAKNIKSISDLKLIDPMDFIPINNRTIARMDTVSSGVFMAIEVSGAAIAAAVENRGFRNPGFTKDFLVSVNYIGVGRFVIAVAVDAKYIADDFKSAYRNFAESRYRTEEDFSGVSALKYMVLNSRCARILYSLELQKTLYDLSQTNKMQEAKTKRTWIAAWKEKITKAVADGNQDYFIEDETEIVRHIQLEKTCAADMSWFHLIGMELMLFRPYTPLGKEEDKSYAKLKVCAGYEEKVFCRMQDDVGYEELISMRNTYKKYAAIISGRNQRMFTGIAATAVVTVASAGLAWVFAPAIAVFVAGESVAGLSGAALVSASLAAVGGGSLAAGGLGMAGGTAIIAGGGALIGITGSSAVAASSATLFASKGATLNECAKLLTFSEYILIGVEKRPDLVQEINDSIEKLVEELKEYNPDINRDDKISQEEKTLAKEKAKSAKYLTKCSSQLEKMTNKYQREDTVDESRTSS